MLTAFVSLVMLGLVVDSAWFHAKAMAELFG
jgi:hypothetical protein